MRVNGTSNRIFIKYSLALTLLLLFRVYVLGAIGAGMLMVLVHNFVPIIQDTF